MTMSDIGNMSSDLNSFNVGDVFSAFSRSRAARFWAIKSRSSCSCEQFPHTEQQYSMVGRAINTIW